MDITIVLVAVLALAAGFLLGTQFSARRPSTATTGLATHSAREAVAPVRESLERFDSRLRDIESSRIEWHSQLREQVESVRATSESLRRETSALATALRRPQQRGAWGELQLRRTAEMAGMLQYCDFELQVSAGDDERAVRPDMVVRLAGGRHLVVDAKVPLDAYLEAAATDDPELTETYLAEHADRIRAHIRELASKQYWSQFADTPEFVILFMPGESFLAEALQTRPDLLEFAAEKKVVLATPMSLIALLRTASLAWSHERLSDNAREIHQLATEFLKRAHQVGDHLTGLGQSLNATVGHFNKAVGSFESRLLPTARKLGDDTAGGLNVPATLKSQARDVTAPELRTDVP